MAAPSPSSSQGERPDVLYTALLVVSAATLLIGIIFMVVRSLAFFEGLWPPGPAA